MILPAVNIPIFVVELPLSWKKSEAKNRLKITRVIVDWMFTKRNEAIRHKIIISTKKTIAIRLIVFNWFTLSLTQSSISEKG
jgi:hypothetical protein